MSYKEKFISTEFFSKLKKYNFKEFEFLGYQQVVNDDFILDPSYDIPGKYHLKQMNISVIDTFPELNLDEEEVLDYLEKYYNKYPLPVLSYTYKVNTEEDCYDSTIISDKNTYYYRVYEETDNNTLNKMFRKTMKEEKNIEFDENKIFNFYLVK